MRNETGRNLTKWSGAITPKGTLAVTAALAALLAAGSSRAQLPMPTSSQFDVTGFIQSATLDASCQASPHCGGTITINGQVITVPKELVTVLPANQLTWQELFTQAPAPYGMASAVPSTGLAMNDLPAPLTQYQAEVIGNRVLGGPAGADLYIAGLINISQNALNSGAGFINFINYSTGELNVGGTLGVANGARVQLNDPVGRYGRVMSPDPRFASDSDNPTITAMSGFPMCVPRTDPGTLAAPGLDDALCPQGNRPLAPSGFSTLFTMNDPTFPGLAGVPPDAARQAPFEVGDWVTYAGTLVTDAATPTTGPMPTTGAAGTYVSAHTITNNVGIYTAPGTNPAYVRIDVSLIGTGGLSVLGVGEAVARTRFEGFSTDQTRNIHLYGLDLNSVTGAITDRDWGQIGIDPGPGAGGGVQGRWRFRPPCGTPGVAAGGNVGGVPPSPPPTQKVCLGPVAGDFIPPTREMRAVLQSSAALGGASAWVPGQVATTANGIIAGQYRAPIQLYIFPENVPGAPIVPNNFNTIPFLSQGGYTSTLGTLVGQLNPWPDSTVPSTSCTVPTANAGGPYTVATVGSVLLSGSAAGTAPLTFTWTVASGTLTNNAANPASPSYSAAGAVSPVTVTLKATNACGTSSSVSTILVNAATAPTMSPISAISVFAGAGPISFAVSATDPNKSPVTFSVTQAGAPSLLGLKVVQKGQTKGTSISTATISFTAPTLPQGQVTPSVITLLVTGTNGKIASDPGTVTVTVKPLPGTLVVTLAEFRVALRRLIVNVTATPDMTAAEVVTLASYVTADGTVFDPTNLGNTFTYTPGGLGLYTITLVGAPEPALTGTPITVTSNTGAVSLPTAITLK